MWQLQKMTNEETIKVMGSTGYFRFTLPIVLSNGIYM